MRRYLLATFLIFTLLLANTAFAQQQQPIFGIGTIDLTSTLGTILTDYIGIIFIIVFIVLLLIIGGVIHFPSTGGGSILALIIFAVLLILAFVFPQFISFPDYLKTVPDNYKIWRLPGPAVQVITMMGLPAEWGYVPAIIYLFILPFAAIYTLFWAFLTSLRLFQQPNVNRILSLIVAFLTIPIGWFTRMVWALFAFMGAWSVAVFAAVFIAGIFFRGAGIVGKEFAEFRKLSDVRKARLREAINKLSAVGNSADAIMTQAPSILRDYADVIPGNAYGQMETGIHEGNPNAFRQGVNLAKRAL
jgi:hypothetical protein